MVDFKQWDGFEGRIWKEEVNVRDFIQKNYTPYDGDSEFLVGPTEATDKLWGILQGLQKEERANGGVLDMETEVVTGLTAYGPGYISEATKDLEKVVGLQTDKPLKRAFMPFGGIKMAVQASVDLIGRLKLPGIQKMGFVQDVIVLIDISSVLLVLAFSVTQNSVFAISTLYAHIRFSPFIEKAPNMTYKHCSIVRDFFPFLF